MNSKNKQIIKSNLHPNNLHNTQYDFALLCLKHPELKPFTYKTEHSVSIDFSDNQGVIQLNTALLKSYYNIQHWQIPPGYLCPAIPGRVDYIHYLAELLQRETDTQVNGKKVTVIDIGTGASCIYPILGQRSYQWSFIASDIDPISIATAKNIITANSGLSKKIKIQHQPNPLNFFKGLINSDKKIDLTMCNPPFHSSLAEALQGNQRKRSNLSKNRARSNRSPSANLNFGGQNAELFCAGGELTFIKSMISESKLYAQQVLYFSCLVSKGSHINALKKHLAQCKVAEVKIINMSQGSKTSRFIAWSFHSETQRKHWCNSRFL